MCLIWLTGIKGFNTGKCWTFVIQFFGTIKMAFSFLLLKGKFSSGTEFEILFKPLVSLVDCMIFKSKYNFVIFELIGQPYCDLERNNSKNV